MAASKVQGPWIDTGFLFMSTWVFFRFSGTMAVDVLAKIKWTMCEWVGVFWCTLAVAGEHKTPDADFRIIKKVLVYLQMWGKGNGVRSRCSEVLSCVLLWVERRWFLLGAQQGGWDESLWLWVWQEITGASLTLWLRRSTLILSRCFPEIQNKFFTSRDELVGPAPPPCTLHRSTIRVVLNCSQHIVEQGGYCSFSTTTACQWGALVEMEAQAIWPQCLLVSHPGCIDSIFRRSSLTLGRIKKILKVNNWLNETVGIVLSEKKDRKLWSLN